MPLGALIAQRRTAVVHAEPRLQTGAAAATAALPADALQQNTDVAAYHDAWAEDTAAASPAIAPQPAAGKGLFTVPIGGRSEHAEAAADTPPSPPSGASRQAATCEKCHTTLQPWPDNRSTTPDQPADHPDAAAAARSLADNAAVDTAADVSALQPPAAAVSAAGAASPEAGAGCAMEHARRHQLEQGSTEAQVPAAGVPSLTAAAGIAADSSLIRTADGAKDSPDSQLPPDAHTVAVLPDGLRGDLLSNAAGLQISCDGGTELLVLRQPEAASPAEAGGVAEAPNASLACAPESQAAATPCAVSPALLITTQDWHRLLGDGATDDAVVSPDSTYQVACAMSPQAVADGVGDIKDLLNEDVTERPAVASQDVVPDSDTSICEP